MRARPREAHVEQPALLGQIITRKTWTANSKHTIRVVNDQGGKQTNFDAFIVLK